MLSLKPNEYLLSPGDGMVGLFLILKGNSLDEAMKGLGETSPEEMAINLQESLRRLIQDASPAEVRGANQYLASLEQAELTADVRAKGALSFLSDPMWGNLESLKENLRSLSEASSRWTLLPEKEAPDLQGFLQELLG